MVICLDKQDCSIFGCELETLFYPLDGGLPVPRELGEVVEILHENPWFWWVGQFMKYGLNLRPEIRQRIENDKYAIAFSNFVHPIVG